MISRQVSGTHAVVHDGVNWKLTNNHQKLIAKGPTTSEYQIVLFVKSQGRSIDINVEYYMKLQRAPAAGPASVGRYYWGALKWKCQEGYGSAKGFCTKTRKLTCKDRLRPKKRTRSNKKPQQAHERVPDSNCDIRKKPSTREEFQCPTGCSKK